MTVSQETLKEHTEAIKNHVTSKFKAADEYLDKKLAWAEASRWTPVIVAAFGVACFALGHIVGKVL